MYPMYSMPTLAPLGPLVLAFLVVIGEAILAVVVYGLYRAVRELAPERPASGFYPDGPDPDFYLEYGSWKQCLLLLGTLAAMFGTAIWAFYMDYDSSLLNTLFLLHFFGFPVMLGTAIFYIFQPSCYRYYFVKIPMKYIYLGYVLLEVIVVFRFEKNEYLSVFLPAGISILYLALAVVALVQKPRIKQAKKDQTK